MIGGKEYTVHEVKMLHHAWGLREEVAGVVVILTKRRETVFFNFIIRLAKIKQSITTTQSVHC